MSVAKAPAFDICKAIGLSEMRCRIVIARNGTGKTAIAM